MFLTKINITIFRNILKKYIYFRDILITITFIRSKIWIRNNFSIFHSNNSPAIQIFQKKVRFKTKFN